MRLKFFVFLTIILLACCETATDIGARDMENLRSGFVEPKDENNLWCYWYWIGDDISKD